MRGQDSDVGVLDTIRRRRLMPRIADLVLTMAIVCGVVVVWRTGDPDWTRFVGRLVGCDPG